MGKTSSLEKKKQKVMEIKRGSDLETGLGAIVEE